MDDPRGFEEIARGRLIERVDRLKRLLELNSPLVVIAKEIGMVTEVGMAFCGPEYPIGLEQLMQERWRIMFGFCIYCEGSNPRRASNPEHACDICQSRGQRDS